MSDLVIRAEGRGAVLVFDPPASAVNPDDLTTWPTLFRTPNLLTRPKIEGITAVAVEPYCKFYDHYSEGGAKRLTLEDVSLVDFACGVHTRGTGNADLSRYVGCEWQQRSDRCDRRGGFLVLDNPQSVAHWITDILHNANSPLVRMRSGGEVVVQGGAAHIKSVTRISGCPVEEETAIYVVEGGGVLGSQNNSIAVSGVKTELHENGFLFRIAAGADISFVDSNVVTVASDTHLQAGNLRNARGLINRFGVVRFERCDLGAWEVECRTDRVTFAQSYRPTVIAEACRFILDPAEFVRQNKMDGGPIGHQNRPIVSLDGFMPYDPGAEQRAVARREGFGGRASVPRPPVPAFTWAAESFYGLPSLKSDLEERRVLLPGMGTVVERVKIVKHGSASGGDPHGWEVCLPDKTVLCRIDNLARTDTGTDEASGLYVVLGGDAHTEEVIAAGASSGTGTLAHRRVQPFSFRAVLGSNDAVVHARSETQENKNIGPGRTKLS